MLKKLLSLAFLVLFVALVLFAAILATYDFEEGNTSDFASTTGDVDAHADAAYAGSWGCRCNSVSQAAAYGTSIDFSITEATLTYYVKVPVTMADGDKFTLVWPDSAYQTFYTQFQRSGSDYQILVVTYGVNSDWIIISKTEWNKIRYYWKRETNSSSNDGILKIWLNDSLEYSDTALADYHVSNEIDVLRFGICSGIDAGTSGLVYFDDIELTDTEPPEEEEGNAIFFGINFWSRR